MSIRDAAKPKPAHALIVRVMHWIGALAILCMILSGWQIYNASPILPFVFPEWMTLGGWLGGGIAWHLSAMWLLVADGLAYLIYGIASGHFRRDFLPIGPRAVGHDLAQALRLRLEHRLGHYNAVQRLLYVGVIVVVILTVLTGVSIWKPVQLGWLTELFGGYDIARLIHFALMSLIVGFLLVHLSLVAVFPRTLVSMLSRVAPRRQRGQPPMNDRQRPAVRPDEIRADLKKIDRRLFLRGGLSLGALSLLTGCDLSTNDSVDNALRAMLRFDDRVQAALFNPSRLAKTYPASAITHPFRFNAYYPEWQVRTVEASQWRLEVTGLVDNKRAWSLAELRALPQEEQITRHVCVEGWSQIGQWSGVPLHFFLRRVGADLRAKYVAFRCFDDYWTSIDMPSALHPQTILTLDFEQKPLEPPWGAPLRLRIPTKLGFKNPKYIASMTVTNDYPGGYWEDQGYNWFSGL